MFKKLFTSESVGPGHPDKICDQISDAILDECLKRDSNSRVACEVMASNNLIIIGGEINTKAYVDVVKTAWSILFQLGYTESDFSIISNMNKQSIEISEGVDKKNGRIGAGDQGSVFGYATNETKEFMPLPIIISHALIKRAETLRLEKKFKWAKSDMKSQVTINYSGYKPTIHTIVMSIQHTSDYHESAFKKYIRTEIMEYIAKQYNLNIDFIDFTNPSGKFVIGGPIGDTGLTGRKIIVDTYGGMARHGGGALSGKDYTKVDRSAAYAARWVAKNIVAAELADKLELQISYAIGVEKPISISIDTFNTAKVEEEKILEIINKVFDLTPLGIINALDLKKPIYQKTATYGHFGRNHFNWEKLDKVEDIKKMLK